MRSTDHNDLDAFQGVMIGAALGVTAALVAWVVYHIVIGSWAEVARFIGTAIAVGRKQ